jgi:1,4-dihydroxy-6-naphthoate synthase
MCCPADVEFVEMRYDLIAEAILNGHVHAGVMIHEELVHYPELGLRCVRDLGAAWSEETGVPLPVGLNIARRALGRDVVEAIARTCRDSLLWAREQRAEAMAFAHRFGRGCAADFVPLFSNDDTLFMPGDVRRGLRVLFDQIAERGWAPRLENIEVIDA